MVGIERKNPFIIPERAPASRLEDEYDQKSFKQWVSDLPIGDVSKIAHALYRETDRLNRLEMSPLERSEALELMLPAVGFVLGKLGLFFSDKPLPLSRENRVVARMHLELLVRVVVGYKTVLAQLHDDSFTGYLLHKRIRSEAARRILYFLGEILLHEYSIYRGSPGFVWKEIHGIYHYAVQNDLHYKQVDASDDDPCDRLSLRDIYKRILLLGVADPKSLLRGEVRKVNEALIQWVTHVTIVPIDDHTSEPPAFLVDATKDAPPCPAGICDREQIKIGWILDTAKLNQILEQKIQSMKGSSSGRLRPIDAVSVRLVARLRSAWGASIVSRDERKPESGVIEVICGLLSLYRLFDGEQFALSTNGKQGLACYTIDTAEQDERVDPIAHDEFIIDAGDELFTGLSSGQEQAPQEEVELEIIDSGTVDEIDSTGCASINRSEKGYYLTWPGESEYKAYVGELVGINSGDNLDVSETWSLGIVRWSHLQKSGHTGYGIEILHGDIEPVRIERWYANDSKADIMLGFQQVVNGKVESTITYPFYIEDRDRFVLVKRAERISVVPDRILECTDAIMRFTIKTDGDGTVAEEAGASEDTASDERFNAIWDDLDL